MASDILVHLANIYDLVVLLCFIHILGSPSGHAMVTASVYYILTRSLIQHKLTHMSYRYRS